MEEVSTKPYLVRAIYEWCEDSGYRPFIAVQVDERTQVPREFVRNGEIVLNISAAATNRLHIGNDLLEFEARFNGLARHVSIPIENVSAIFARENGHGMAFEVPARGRSDAGDGDAADAGDGPRVPLRDVAEPTAEPAASGDDGREAATSGAESGDSSQEPGAEQAPVKVGKRTGSGRAAKRARKTVLRDVNSPEMGDDRTTPAEKPAASDENRRPKSRSRKPAIAAVPRSEKPEDKQGESGVVPPSAAPDRPHDDDPGPGAPPRGKPRLTRVK